MLLSPRPCPSPPFLTRGQPLPQSAFAIDSRSTLSTGSGGCCGTRQQGTSRELRCDIRSRSDRHSYHLLREQNSGSGWRKTQRPPRVSKVDLNKDQLAFNALNY